MSFRTVVKPLEHLLYMVYISRFEVIVPMKNYTYPEQLDGGSSNKSIDLKL